MQDSNKIIITILYDNYQHLNTTTADWGFSCLIKGMEKTILFDTGTNPSILNNNITILNADLSEVSTVFISHNHRDHTGGLNFVLDKNSEIDLYMPHSTPKETLNELRPKVFKLHHQKSSVNICEAAYSTGELGTDIKEQSLILNTKNGLVIITGCSHPGIISIIQTAKEISQQEVYLVLGGFHLLRHNPDDIQSIVSDFKALGVQKCAASHCTGDEAIAMFKNEYGQDFIEMGSGKIISLER